MIRAPLASLVLALAPAFQEPSVTSAPALEFEGAARKAASAGKILMVWFEPSGVPEVLALDAAIAGDAALKASFDKRFALMRTTLLDAKGAELERRLGHPVRGGWPGIALVGRGGELLSIVDPASWKSDGRFDPARIRAFVEFWSAPLPKDERVKKAKEKYGDIYRPEADAKAEIAAAVARAKAEGKHVIVKVGGNWCPWCYLLHDALESDAQLRAELERGYVLVRVSYDEKNKNEAALAELGHPERFGFPVLVVLDGDGKRMHTQDSGLLESGDHHDAQRVLGFLRGWSPRGMSPDAKR